MKKNSFNGISFCYDMLAQFWFGKAIIDSQTAFLEIIPEDSKVLIIGGGTGEILEEISKMKRKIRIDYIEFSSKMLQKAMLRKVDSNCEIFFINGDETNICDDEVYDVVITCFFLDVFQQVRLEMIVKKLSASLNENGLWLLSDFYMDKHTSLIHRFILWLMYRFFGLVSNIEAKYLIMPDKLLQNHYLKPIAQSFFYKDLIRSMVWVKC